jgi:hypothetical protein
MGEASAREQRLAVGAEASLDHEILISTNLLRERGMEVPGNFVQPGRCLVTNRLNLGAAGAHAGSCRGEIFYRPDRPGS